MFTFLGSLLGFFSSFAPEILKYFQDSKDKKHELATMDKQLQLMDKRAELRITEQRVDGEIKMDLAELQQEIDSTRGAHSNYDSEAQNTSRWVNNLRASVRPMITYLFMIEYIAMHIAIQYLGKEISWSDSDYAIFATIISFWFGDRIRKYMNGNRT